MCPYKMVIQIYDQTVKSVIDECSLLANVGDYDSAIRLIDNLMESHPIDGSSQYYQLILKKQSYLYNSGKFKSAMNELQMLISKYGQQFIDKYYLCRIYLAMGSVSCKATHGTQKYIIDHSLSYYSKAKRLYYQLLLEKDKRVLHNLQLKVKIYLNILLLIQQNHDIKQRPHINIKKSIGLYSKFTSLIKSSVSFEQIEHNGKLIVIDKQISQFLQNLVQIKSDVLLLGDSQIIDYYKIFYILLLQKAVTNNLISNVSYVKVKDKVYDINYIIQLVHQVVYGMNIQKMSHRNKVSIIRAVYGLPQIIGGVLQAYINTFIIINKHGYGYILTDLMNKVKDKWIDIVDYDKIEDFNLMSNKVSWIDVETNKYSIEFMDIDQIKMQCEQIANFVCKYKIICSFSQHIINMVTKNITQQVFQSVSLQLYDLYMTGYKNIHRLFDNQFRQSYFLKYFNIKQRIIKLIYNSKQGEFNTQEQKCLMESLTKTVAMCYYYLLNQNRYQSAIIHLNYLKNCQDIITQLRMNSTYQSLQSINQILYDKMRYISQLEQSNGLLQTYAYTMAHDLISPIRGINNFVAELYNHNFQKLDEVGQQSLSIIRKSATQAIQLIQSSYEYSQIGKQINKEQFDIVQSIINVVKKHVQIVTRKNIIITVIQESFIGNVYGDKILLENVISNLLSNAIKACNKKQSHIEIGLFKGTWLYIKDNGRGMEKIEQDKIFKLFYRGNYSDDQGGSGLGMAIVKRILDKHDSIITIQSEVGIGTTVSFTVPIVK